MLLVTSPTESLSDGEAAQYIEGVTSVWNLTNLALESPIIHADIERVGSVWSITIIRSIMDPMFPIQSLSFTRFVWACLLGNTSSVKVRACCAYIQPVQPAGRTHAIRADRWRQFFHWCHSIGSSSTTSGATLATGHCDPCRTRISGSRMFSTVWRLCREVPSATTERQSQQRK